MGKHLITFMAMAASLAVPHVDADAVYEHGRFKTKVIEDRGGLSARAYMPVTMQSKAWGKKLHEERGTRRLIDSAFPVRTPSMTVGRVGLGEGNQIPAAASVMQSMFIIGDDPVSRRWLQDNREFLASKKAIGLVVNVETKESMNQLARIAGKGIRMQPTPGEDLAKHMGIKHYPFYIDKDGIMR